MGEHEPADRDERATDVRHIARLDGTSADDAAVDLTAADHRAETVEVTPIVAPEFLRADPEADAEDVATIPVQRHPSPGEPLPSVDTAGGGASAAFESVEQVAGGEGNDETNVFSTNQVQRFLKDFAVAGPAEATSRPGNESEPPTGYFKSEEFEEFMKQADESASDDS